MASSLVPECLVMSDLLTIRERGVLFTLLEPHCKLIKTTVTQVLVAKETQGKSPGWSCLGCGAICLIEDESMCSYFLRLYCVKRAKLLWEQELYIPFKYTAARKFFHTFPADDHQVGLNFANEAEAEEFQLSVEAIQRNQEKTTKMTEVIYAEKGHSSTTDPPDFGIKTPDHLDELKHFLMDASSTEVTATNSDLDPSMRRLLLQAKFTENDLKDKDIAEAVDCIINKFGGLKAVQRELRNKGPISQTLPRSAGASISLALKKGPLPPIPPLKGSSTQGTDTPLPSWIPPPPSVPAPADPERIRKSASFRYVGSPTAAQRSDQILTALKEVFRQKQLLQSQQESDTNKQI